MIAAARILLGHSRALSVCYLAILLLAGCAQLKQCAYEGFNRDEWQQPQKVLAALEIQPGAIVADLGAGGGYFTFRLADAVGPKGKVYAVDIDRSMVDLIAAEAKERAAANIEPILGSPADPRLPKNRVDLIFTSNTYHHIEDRVAYFRRLKEYLRPGGRIAIVELDHRDWMVRMFGHYSSGEVIKKEMAQAGYEVRQEFNFLDRQSFLIFAAK